MKVTTGKKKKKRSKKKGKNHQFHIHGAARGWDAESWELREELVEKGFEWYCDGMGMEKHTCLTIVLTGVSLKNDGVATCFCEGEKVAILEYYLECFSYNLSLC